MQRCGQVVITMIAHVKQKTIEPLIKETIAPGTFVYTDAYSMYARLGCLKWLLAVDRFLDSRCQSRLSSAWWRSIFKEQGVIQARQLRAMEIFVSI